MGQRFDDLSQIFLGILPFGRDPGSVDYGPVFASCERQQA